MTTAVQISGAGSRPCGLVRYFAFAQQARAEKSEIEPSKLLEENDVERLDTGAPGAAGAAHQDVETVGALNRPDDRGGQGSGRAQCVERRKPPDVAAPGQGPHGSA